MPVLSGHRIYELKPNSVIPFGIAVFIARLMSCFFPFAIQQVVGNLDVHKKMVVDV